MTKAGKEAAAAEAERKRRRLNICGSNVPCQCWPQFCGSLPYRPSAVDRNPGKGHDCQTTHRLAKEPRRLEDAEEQQVLDFRAGLLVGRSADDAIVVDAARSV